MLARMCDPFELIDESWDVPGAGMFAPQLRIAADRLVYDDWGPNVIAERGPINFLDYLLAMADLTGDAVAEGPLEHATSREILARGSPLARRWSDRSDAPVASLALAGVCTQSSNSALSTGS
jgi:hypothetical protein